jgi:ERCC4-type nuclease
MDNFEIIIDSREQTPWSFSDYVKTRVCKLNCGDYALAGDDKFSIERKSKNDFLSTISSGWKRFKRELDRMIKDDFIARVIIVECDFQDFCFSEFQDKIIPPGHEHYQLTPQFIYSQIAYLTINNVSVIFAGDAFKASELCYRMLIERYKKIEANKNTKS